MAKNINELEKSFYKQRERIIKSLKNEEAAVSKEYSTLMGQLKVLKAKKGKVAAMDKSAKKTLGDLKAKLERMHRQQIDDVNNVKFMKKRIAQLRREIPYIKRSISKSVPELRKLARMDRKLEVVLGPLNKKITDRQAAVVELRAKMKKLNNKEDFIKRGTIVWGEFRKHVKRRPAKKPQAQGQKKGSIFDAFRRK